MNRVPVRELTDEQESILEAARLVMADVGPLDVLSRLFPNPLTRPLYTIGDMDMHVQRAIAEDTLDDKSVLS
jgi:hypothetical protein